MADEPTDQPLPQLDFVGMQDVVALYADAFFVAKTGDAFSLYFFQNQLGDMVDRELKKTESVRVTKTKCFARIVITPSGLSNLVEALAANIGIEIVRTDSSDKDQ
jgi:hypothetical protein